MTENWLEFDRKFFTASTAIQAPPTTVNVTEDEDPEQSVAT